MPIKNVRPELSSSALFTPAKAQPTPTPMLDRFRIGDLRRQWKYDSGPKQLDSFYIPFERQKTNDSSSGSTAGGLGLDAGISFLLLCLVNYCWLVECRSAWIIVLVRDVYSASQVFAAGLNE